MPNNHWRIQRFILGFILLLTTVVLIKIVNLGFKFDIFSRSRNVKFFFGVSLFFNIIFLVFVLLLLLATWSSKRKSIPQLFNTIFATFTSLKSFNLVLFGIGITIFSFLMIGPFNRFFGDFFLRWTIFSILVLSGTFFIKAAFNKLGWYQSIVLALLVSTVGYRIAAFVPGLSTYPFSLGWSEGSRYYYASLYLSKSLYGFKIPPTVLHPSRYLMQALPFLIPDSPIFLHRFWQTILWFATTLTTAFLLARRLHITDGFQRLVFILWASLFILMAPVYYHLQIPIILVLWGFDRRKPWRTILVILLASVWAGISRVNWFPVPGMLAATLYFLEIPVSASEDKSKSLIRYLIEPVLWVSVGTLTAFISQILYAILSNNPLDQFSSSFASDLLWYRLFPNPTYPLGILTGSLLVVIPLLLFIFYKLRYQWHLYHPIRILGCASILFVLYSGGLVVSVKIGGGSNLHNLDASLIVLITIFSYVFFERLAPENNVDSREITHHQSKLTYRILLGITLMIPVFFTINLNVKYHFVSENTVRESIAKIQQAINTTTSDGNDVLFITERQLLVFDTIHSVSMVPEYEKVFLMEMAMANNTDYLNNFYENLRNHQYALIISEPLKIVSKGRSEQFGEENNAWVERVAKPLLCYYEPIEIFKKVRVELLVPRQDTSNCP